MTKQDEYVLKSIAAGLAWPVIVKVLNECVELEQSKSFDATTAEDAARAVFRSQGGKNVVNRFIRAAEQAAAQGEAE